MEAARARGLAVPGNVGVVGFDDVPAAALGAPAPTTVAQPHEEKGRLAGAALLAALAGEESRAPESLPGVDPVRWTP